MVHVVVRLLVVVAGTLALDPEALVESLLEKLNGTSVGPAIEGCLGDLGSVAANLNASVAAFEAGSATSGLDGLYLSTRALARAVDGCDVPVALGYLEKGANAIGFNATAAYAGEALSVVVLGLNVTEDVALIAADLAAGDAQGAGAALGSLLVALDGAFSCDGDTGGALAACALFDGLLDGALLFMRDAAPCEAQLEAALAEADAAGAAVVAGDGRGVFVHSVGTLSALGRSADACGLPDLAALLRAGKG